MKTEQVPTQLPDGKVEDIRNAPISSRNAFTTLSISFKYAFLYSVENPLFLGDLVKRYACPDLNQTELMGIVRRLYMIPSDSNIYADIQTIELITSYQRPLPKDFTALPTEYILKEEILERIIPDKSLFQKKFKTTAENLKDEILIRKKVVKIGDKIVLKNFYGTVSSSKNNVLHYLRRCLSKKEKEKLVVLFIEVSKDEFVSFRTRSYLVDTVNWIFSNLPFEIRERFMSLWTIAAFSPYFPEQERYLDMVRMMTEGEKGFWVWNAASKESQYVVCCFGLINVDMAEATKLQSSVEKNGNAIVQCNRCAVDKKNLCNPLYPIHATEMDPEKRIAIYEQAAAIPSQNEAAKFLSQNYGVKTKVPWFLFLSSLRLPQQAMADLLHTWGINIALWVWSLVWYILNHETRKKLLELLKHFGQQFNNGYISKLFKTRKGQMIDEKLNLSEIKKTTHMQGTDVAYLMQVIEEIVIQLLSRQEIFNIKFPEYISKITIPEWRELGTALDVDFFQLFPSSPWSNCVPATVNTQNNSSDSGSSPQTNSTDSANSSSSNYSSNSTTSNPSSIISNSNSSDSNTTNSSSSNSDRPPSNGSDSSNTCHPKAPTARILQRNSRTEAVNESYLQSVHKKLL